MSDIIDDIVDEIQLKPNKTKKLIKWIIAVALFVITIAFGLGQFLNKISSYDDDIKKNSDECKVINNKVNDIYDNVNREFNYFRDYNDKQLFLIIDYSDGHKDLLKRTIELNSIENSKNMQNNIKSYKSK